VTSQSSSDPLDMSLLNELQPSLMENDINPSTNTIPDPSPLQGISSTSRVPILRCVDKPSSSLPSRLTLNEDLIRASVRFHHIDTIKHHLTSLYQETLKLDSTPGDAVLDMGALATPPKSSRNTTPVPCPLAFGDVITWTSFLAQRWPWQIHIMACCSLIDLVG
jgi:hypothetical protein